MTYYIVYGFVKLLSLLPFAVLYALSDVLYPVIYYIIGYRKQVVRDNLSYSFPEKTEQERKTIEKKFYRHFCDLIFENIKSLSHMAAMPIASGNTVAKPERATP